MNSEVENPKFLLTLPFILILSDVNYLLQWTFQLDVDGTSLFKKNYNSDKPIYRNVDVYIGDKFHEPALVKIKNFEYTEGIYY